MRAGYRSPRRRVWVNGTHCESMVAGAREATRLLGVKVHVWQIWRILKGRLAIEGLEVSEGPPKRKDIP